MGIQSGTPRHARIFDKMDIINVITNTYSRSIKAVDTRYSNIIYSTGIPLREIPTLIYCRCESRRLEESVSVRRHIRGPETATEVRSD